MLLEQYQYKKSNLFLSLWKGRFEIQSEEENHLAHWSIIKLNIISHGKMKIVHHLKFHAWPDCGVPEFPAPFLAFLER